MEVPAAVERDESAASLALAAERERLALCSEEGGVRLFFAEAEAARVLPLAPRLRLLVPARPLRELHRPSPLPRLTFHFGYSYRPPKLEGASGVNIINAARGVRRALFLVLSSGDGGTPTAEEVR